MRVITILTTLLFFKNEVSCSEANWEKHVAASTQDLSRLFAKEVDLLDNLDEWLYKIKAGKIPMTGDVQSDVDFITKSLGDLEIDKWRSESALSYVSHPINAFHLMKRTATIWPQLFESTISRSLEDVMEGRVDAFPEEEDFYYGACVGLVNIELYYGLTGTSLMDLALGRVTDPAKGIVYQAKHNLTSDDLLSIARAAKRVWKLDKNYEWTKAAVDVARDFEEKSSMELRPLQRKIAEAKELHDDFLLQYGINSKRAKIDAFDGAPDSQPSAPLFTATEPYDEELLEVPSYKKARKRYKKELEKSQPFIDMREDDHKDGRFMDTSFHRMRTTMLQYSRRLCNGDESFRPPHLDANLKCLYLHYHSPYLRLGPFKYEPVNDDPHVGLIRDFLSSKSLDDFLADSEDKLHSTIYYEGNNPRFYTSQRSSKRRHMDEDETPSLLSTSKRLSLATRWLVHQSYKASEHYHTINYGIGGQIEVHVDFWGPGLYDAHPGGNRMVTFLTYASEPVGGYTIFPGLGLHVKPKKGDGLFWLTLTNDRDYDTRMFHMGCPVLWGSKWVLTKWLYSDDQMWMHPCVKDISTRRNFPLFDNSLRFRESFNLDPDED